MKKINILSKNTIYFIGIGGISMSGLCQILLSLDKKVLGSDANESDETLKLKSQGVTVFIGHNEKNITDNIDLVVYSGAIKQDNCEIIKAQKLGIPIMERSEFLGYISMEYSNVIAIAGTHGKTTTTSVLGYIFKNAGLNPTIHVGGHSLNLNGNTIVGGRDYFILEACEYRNSFQYLKPNLAIITNIERDHLDYFKNIKNLHSAFQNFANNSQVLVIDKKIKINHYSKIKVGLDYKVENIKFENKCYTFDVYKKDELWLSLKVNLIGEYNIYNVLNAVIVADYFNIAKDVIVSSVATFVGVARRNEIIGYILNCPILCDYAHHPTELKCSINGLNKVYSNPLYVFQPHTYSRTLTLFSDFCKVLQSVPNLIIYKTYPAREEELLGGTAKDLHLSLNNSMYADNIDDLIEYIKFNIQKYDCIVVLGAGNLANDFRHLLKKS